jgi:hypothetical protein
VSNADSGKLLHNPWWLIGSRSPRVRVRLRPRQALNFHTPTATANGDRIRARALRQGPIDFAQEGKDVFGWLDLYDGMGPSMDW